MKYKAPQVAAIFLRLALAGTRGHSPLGCPLDEQRLLPEGPGGGGSAGMFTMCVMHGTSCWEKLLWIRNDGHSGAIRHQLQETASHSQINQPQNTANGTWLHPFQSLIFLYLLLSAEKMVVFVFKKVSLKQNKSHSRSLDLHPVFINEGLPEWITQLRIQGGGAGGPWPPPVPVKTSHKKDGRHQRPLIFHVSWPPPSDHPGSDTVTIHLIGSCDQRSNLLM